MNIALFDSWLLRAVLRDRATLAKDLRPSGSGPRHHAQCLAERVIDEEACAGEQFAVGRPADGQVQRVSLASKIHELFTFSSGPSAIGWPWPLVAPCDGRCAVPGCMSGGRAWAEAASPRGQRGSRFAGSPCRTAQESTQRRPARAENPADGGDDLFGHQLQQTNQLAPTTMPCDVHASLPRAGARVLAAGQIMVRPSRGLR
jgi:hypothetical protein